MPDWKQIVRSKLRVVGACLPEFTEELAGHLEGSYEAALREGLPVEMAFQHTPWASSKAVAGSGS